MKQHHLKQHGWTQRLSPSKTNQRQISYDIIYTWTLENGTYEPMKQKQAHEHRKQTYGY